MACVQCACIWSMPRLATCDVMSHSRYFGFCPGDPTLPFNVIIFEDYYNNLEEKKFKNFTFRQRPSPPRRQAAISWRGRLYDFFQLSPQVGDEDTTHAASCPVWCQWTQETNSLEVSPVSKYRRPECKLRLLWLFAFGPAYDNFKSKF